MSDLDNLARIIETERTWTKRMSDGCISTGSNTSEHIAQALISAGWINLRLLVHDKATATYLDN